MLWSLLWLSLLWGAVAGFDCINNKVGRCQCSIHSQADYEVNCPFIEAKFQILLDMNRHASLTCNQGTTYLQVVEYLQGINIGIIKHLVIVNCPVPEDSFLDFMERRLNATGVEYLTFRSGIGRLTAFNLEGLIHLATLDLSGSLIDTRLDKTFFQGLSNLTNLDLSGNKRLKLELDTFHSLSNLLELNVNNCDLTEVHADLFLHLTSLRSLNINSNQLSSMPSALFNDLVNLRMLYIKSNQLASLPRGILDPLTSLTNIDMGENHYESLPDNLFSKNVKLEHITFLRNGDYCSSPEDCESRRRLELPPTLFQIPSIRSIKILRVPLVSLPTDLLRNTTNLRNLTIQSSYFSHLEPGLFKDCSGLEHLDLAGNEIRNLTDGIFDGLFQLTRLRLLKNRITEISERVFRDLVKLERLELHENHISKIHKNSFAFQKALKVLDLTSNSLVYSGALGNWFLSPHVFENLVSLNLSRNSFSALEETVLINFLKLEVLNLSYNSFSEFNVLEFNFIKFKKVYIDLSYNQIERVNLTYTPAMDILFKDKENIFDLNLVGNPLICDCFITELKQKLEGKLLSVIKNVFNIDPPNGVKCGEKSPPALYHRPLRSVKDEDLNCHFPSDVLSYRCPRRCGCSWNRYNKEIQLNCTGQGFTAFPEFLPRIENSKLLVHLENNKISNLSAAVSHYYGTNQTNFSDIVELYLSNNQIEEFHQELLPPRLRVLHLDGNRITRLQQTDINFFDVLINSTGLTLKLGKNPYSCSCESRDLYHFVRDRSSEIRDVSSMVLDCGAADQVPLVKSNIADFCTNLPSPVIIIAIVVILVVLLSLIIFLIFFSCYKDMFLIWVYSKGCLRCMFSKELIDMDKPYDAFISYSHHDADFVNQVLVPGLESPDDSSYKYRCLTHEKDWLVGNSIPESIMDSVQSSRRTLIVLSRGFITSMWSKMEFRAAHTQALQDRTQRVVIILHGELPPENEMEEDLKKYISMNTYIDSENPWFWQRLRYALPHKGGGFRFYRRTPRSRRETDQLELMRAQAEAELGKSSRTPSPPTLSEIVATDDVRNKNGYVNGTPSVNGLQPMNGYSRYLNGSVNGSVKPDLFHGFPAVVSEKERATEDYLRRVVPSRDGEAGRVVRDILVQSNR